MQDQVLNGKRIAILVDYGTEEDGLIVICHGLGFIASISGC